MKDRAVLGGASPETMTGPARWQREEGLEQCTAAVVSSQMGALPAPRSGQGSSCHVVSPEPVRR